MLTEIVEGIGKTSDLIGEIAAASQEQAQGIDQVNTAVNQMDKVTQQNAANAEESASASEELSAQAEQMNSVVGELIALVGGSAKRTSSQSYTKTASSIERKFTHSDNAFHQIASKPASQTETVATTTQAKATAEQSIPLEDSDDFKDFNS